jgi:hypothetical protein
MYLLVGIAIYLIVMVLTTIGLSRLFRIINNKYDKLDINDRDL